MRKLKLLIAAIIFTAASMSCKNQKEEKDYAVDIQNLYSRLSSLSADLDSVVYDVNESEAKDNAINVLQDSLKKTNDDIVCLLIDHSNSLEHNLSGIKKTGINVVVSKNNNLICYSWDMGLADEAPYFNNVICYKINDRSKALHYSGINRNGVQFGDNLSIDSLYETTFDHEPLYLLVRSNKCGHTCILNELVPLQIKQGKLVDSERAFQQDNKYYNKLSLSYNLSKHMKGRTIFGFNPGKNAICVPVMNEEKTDIIGMSIYKIAR